jgi:hypothetical protein
LKLPDRGGFDEGRMEWLFILLLAGVTVWQGARIGALTRRVA